MQSANLWANTRIAMLGYYFAFIVMFLMVADVFGRYLLSSPVPATMEVSESMLVYLLGLGIALTQINRRHINISMLTDRLNHRCQKWLIVFGDCLSFFLFSIMSFQSYKIATTSLKFKESYGNYFIPIYPAKFAFFLGTVLLSFTLLLGILAALTNADIKEEVKG
jgi:TRAP-type C4-dicarboxylate transport system permease small subunit